MTQHKEVDRTKALNNHQFKNGEEWSTKEQNRLSSQLSTLAELKELKEDTTKTPVLQVKRGDTLGAIAKALTGKLDWGMAVDYRSDKLKNKPKPTKLIDTNLIYPDQYVWIENEKIIVSDEIPVEEPVDVSVKKVAATAVKEKTEKKIEEKDDKAKASSSKDSKKNADDKKKKTKKTVPKPTWADITKQVQQQIETTGDPDTQAQKERKTITAIEDGTDKVLLQSWDEETPVKVLKGKYKIPRLDIQFNSQEDTVKVTNLINYLKNKLIGQAEDGDKNPFNVNFFTGDLEFNHRDNWFLDREIMDDEEMEEKIAKIFDNRGKRQEFARYLNSLNLWQNGTTKPTPPKTSLKKINKSDIKQHARANELVDEDYDELPLHIRAVVDNFAEVFGDQAPEGLWDKIEKIADDEGVKSNIYLSELLEVLGNGLKFDDLTPEQQHAIKEFMEVADTSVENFLEDHDKEIDEHSWVGKLLGGHISGFLSDKNSSKLSRGAGAIAAGAITGVERIAEFATSLFGLNIKPDGSGEWGQHPLVLDMLGINLREGEDWFKTPGIATLVGFHPFSSDKFRKEGLWEIPDRFSTVYDERGFMMALLDGVEFAVEIVAGNKGLKMIPKGTGAAIKNAVIETAKFTGKQSVVLLKKAPGAEIAGAVIKTAGTAIEKITPDNLNPMPTVKNAVQVTWEKLQQGGRLGAEGLKEVTQWLKNLKSTVEKEITSVENKIKNAEAKFEEWRTKNSQKYAERMRKKQQSIDEMNTKLTELKKVKTEIDKNWIVSDIIESDITGLSSEILEIRLSKAFELLQKEAVGSSDIQVLMDFVKRIQEKQPQKTTIWGGTKNLVSKVLPKKKTQNITEINNKLTTLGDELSILEGNIGKGLWSRLRHPWDSFFKRRPLNKKIKKAKKAKKALEESSDVIDTFDEIVVQKDSLVGKTVEYNAGNMTETITIESITEASDVLTVKGKANGHDITRTFTKDFFEDGGLSFKVNG